MRRLHIIATALACVATIVTATGESTAASSRACRQIEAELAAGDGGGSNARVRQFERAIVRQREQLDIIRDQAHEAGCGFALAGRNIRQCASLNRTLDRMLVNLDKLERDRSRLARTGSTRSRQSLLAALDANGCRDQPIIAEEPPTPLGELLAREDAEAGILDPFEPAEPMEDVQRFRTMCVRTCDGYFYPMSNAATVSDFDRDQKNCETSCPGTEMQMYYDAAGMHDPAAMVSTRTGATYSTLPTAFVHQDVSVPRNPQCGCGVAKNFEVIAGTPRTYEPERPADVEEPAEGTIGGLPIPTPRPDSEAETAAVPDAVAEPPAQAAPSSGGSIITVEPPKQPQPSQAAAPPAAVTEPPAQPPAEADANRSVRVVGPQFLPDPEGALDLRGPDRTTDR